MIPRELVDSAQVPGGPPLRLVRHGRDYIIMLDEGEIVEQGTNDELIGSNGAYRELYEKQLQTEEV